MPPPPLGGRAGAPHRGVSPVGANVSVVGHYPRRQGVVVEGGEHDQLAAAAAPAPAAGPPPQASPPPQPPPR